MKKKHKDRKAPVQEIDYPMTPATPIITDPLGSYTGVCVDVMDMPVQDADDL